MKTLVVPPRAAFFHVLAALQGRSSMSQSLADWVRDSGADASTMAAISFDSQSGGAKSQSGVVRLQPSFASCRDQGPLSVLQGTISRKLRYTSLMRYGIPNDSIDADAEYDL